MDEEKHLREQELEIKKKDQERDAQRQKLAKDQHRNMIAMMNQQREMQQQQQQNNLLLALFQKAFTK